MNITFSSSAQKREFYMKLYITWVNFSYVCKEERTLNSISWGSMDDISHQCRYRVNEQKLLFGDLIKCMPI